MMGIVPVVSPALADFVERFRCEGGARQVRRTRARPVRIDHVSTEEYKVRRERRHGAKDFVTPFCRSTEVLSAEIAGPEKTDIAPVVGAGRGEKTPRSIRRCAGSIARLDPIVVPGLRPKPCKRDLPGEVGCCGYLSGWASSRRGEIWVEGVLGLECGRNAGSRPKNGRGCGHVAACNTVGYNRRLVLARNRADGKR